MTKQSIQDNVAKNNMFDRALMGIAAFIFMIATAHDILRYIRAAQPINFMLAGLAVGLLAYMLLAPMFRK